MNSAATLARIIANHLQDLAGDGLLNLQVQLVGETITVADKDRSYQIEVKKA